MDHAGGFIIIARRGGGHPPLTCIMPDSQACLRTHAMPEHRLDGAVGWLRLFKTLRSIIIIRRRQSTVGASDIHPSHNPTPVERRLLYHRHCHHHSQSPAFPFQPPHSSLTLDHTTANPQTHSTNNRNTYKNHHECQRKTTTIQAAACLRLRLHSPYPCRSRTSNNKHHRRLLRHSRPRLHTRSMTGLLHPTVPALTSDHTHSLRRRNG
jgi:hypothetical protein